MSKDTDGLISQVKNNNNICGLMSVTICVALSYLFRHFRHPIGFFDFQNFKKDKLIYEN